MLSTTAKTQTPEHEAKWDTQPETVHQLQGQHIHETPLEGAGSRPATDDFDFPESLTQVKPEPVISATGINHYDSVSSSSGPCKPTGRSWKTTLFRFGPLSGLLCIFLAVLSLLVSLGILMGSRNAPVANWSIPPSSILAVCTAIANQALRCAGSLVVKIAVANKMLRFAAFQGIAIAWWFRAAHGSTLRKLHTDWRAGTTVLGAVAAGRNMVSPLFIVCSKAARVADERTLGGALITF